LTDTVTGHRSPLVGGGAALSGPLPRLTKIGQTITPRWKNRGGKASALSHCRFDEGTCGRRPRVRGLQGSGCSV